MFFIVDILFQIAAQRAGSFHNLNMQFMNLNKAVGAPTPSNKETK